MEYQEITLPEKCGTLYILYLRQSECMGYIIIKHIIMFTISSCWLKSVRMPYVVSLKSAAWHSFAAYLFSCRIEEAHDATGLPQPGEVRAMDSSGIGAGGVLPGKE